MRDHELVLGEVRRSARGRRFFGCWLTNAGAIMKPSAGTVTTRRSARRGRASRLRGTPSGRSARSPRPSSPASPAELVARARAAVAARRRVSGSTSGGATSSPVTRRGSRGSRRRRRSPRRRPRRSTSGRSADEDEDDTDRKADRPQARARKMVLVAIRFHGQRRTREGVAELCRICPFPAAGSSEMPYSAQRCVTRSRISGDISISGGHSRVPSSGPLCVASMPILPP